MSNSKNRLTDVMTVKKSTAYTLFEGYFIINQSTAENFSKIVKKMIQF